MLETDFIEELTLIDGGKYKLKSLNESYEFCEKLTKSHYENFPVASIILPKEKRKSIYPIYAFARLADDIADNITISNKIEKLENIEKFINNPNSNHPIIYALQDTLSKENIDIQLLKNLLKAFKYDSDFKNFNNFESINSYCVNSANPIGRIILCLFNENNNINNSLSDKICTALQLTNFIQDLSLDIEQKRLYIPLNMLDKYSINGINDIYNKNEERIDSLISEYIGFIEKLYDEGSLLLSKIKSKRLYFELKFIILGGKFILNQCKDLKSELLYKRPSLSKSDFFSLFLRVILWK